jgi:uncharacterized protein (TIGR02300 family)
MSKATLGTKRVCPSCAARFYDLGHSPITCSVCQAVYPVTPAASSRRSARTAPVEEKKPEVVEADPPVPTSADVISLDEAAEAEEAAATEKAIGDIGDVEDIPDSDDDDDTFLEEEEEGETDVAGIVGGGTKEES